MVDFIKEQLKNYNIIYALSKKTYHLILSLKNWLKRIVTLPFLLVPLDDKKIFIVSYFGKGYGDSGKAIVDQILCSSPNSKYNVYWAVSDESQKKYFPNEIKTIKYGSLKYYYHMSTAKIWVDNARKVEYPFKRTKQYYIQTWHGGIAFKKIEKDAEKKLSKYYLSLAYRDSKMVDLMTSNSTFQTNLIKNSFWYDGEILEIGTPRVDTLIKNNDNIDYKRQIRKSLSIPEDNSVIMYAPTFRKNHSTKPYISNYSKLIDNLGDNYTLLVRMHPNIDNFHIESKEGYLVDVTDYPDMYDLMAISDILITDYSSSMFEFSYMSKPVFLLMKDYEDYMKDRGSYFNLSELPFPIAETEEQLLYLIDNFDEEKYLKDISLFNQRLGIIEKGEASSLLLERINQETQN